MKYKKIRGLKRKKTDIQNWISSAINLNMEHLNQYKFEYTKIQVAPWNQLTLTNSQIPEPKGSLKIEILKGLEKIYNHWKIKLNQLDQPYYLKIWVYEPRLSKSQVVCALGEKITYYERIFENAHFDLKTSYLIHHFDSEFTWQSRIDADQYLESELLWSIENHTKIEDKNEVTKFLNKLKSKNYKTKTLTTSAATQDTLYFVPKGKIWVGQK